MRHSSLGFCQLCQNLLADYWFKYQLLSFPLIHYFLFVLIIRLTVNKKTINASWGTVRSIMSNNPWTRLAGGSTGDSWQCPEHSEADSLLASLCPLVCPASHGSSRITPVTAAGGQSGQGFLSGSRTNFGHFLWSVRNPKKCFKSFSIHILHLNSVGHR